MALAFILALSAGCHGCLRTADGAFIFRGMVVDRFGKAVPNVTVKARNESVVTDQDGCFAIFEMTYPYKHEMPFSVVAAGFRPYVGTVTSVDSSSRLMRISLTESKSTAEAVIDASVKKGTLGICEAKAFAQR